VSIFLDAGNNYVTIVAKNDSHKVNVENKFAVRSPSIISPLPSLFSF